MLSKMVDIRKKAHPNCVACSLSNAYGMQLEFVPSEDGDVAAQFKCGDQYESFPGMLHGGVISTILDSAMTNCLFAHGYVAVTADFRVQFRHPVTTDQQAIARAWITNSIPPVHELKAEIVQNGQIKTVASGRFMEQPQWLNKASSQKFEVSAELVRQHKG